MISQIKSKQASKGTIGNYEKLELERDKIVAELFRRRILLIQLQNAIKSRLSENSQLQRRALKLRFQGRIGQEINKTLPKIIKDIETDQEQKQPPNPKYGSKPGRDLQKRPGMPHFINERFFEHTGKPGDNRPITPPTAVPAPNQRLDRFHLRKPLKMPIRRPGAIAGGRGGGMDYIDKQRGDRHQGMKLGPQISPPQTKPKLDIHANKNDSSRNKGPAVVVAAPTKQDKDGDAGGKDESKEKGGESVRRRREEADKDPGKPPRLSIHDQWVRHFGVRSSSVKHTKPSSSTTTKTTAKTTTKDRRFILRKHPSQDDMKRDPIVISKVDQDGQVRNYTVLNDGRSVELKVVLNHQQRMNEGKGNTGGRGGNGKRPAEKAKEEEEKKKQGFMGRLGSWAKNTWNAVFG